VIALGLSLEERFLVG